MLFFAYLSCIKYFLESKQWKILNAIKEEHPDFNFSVCLGAKAVGRKIDVDLIDATHSLTIPFFFGYHATRFEDVHYLLSLGVSQIYITENLGFDIVNVSTLCRQKGVLVRVYPNVTQSYLDFDQGLKRFFLRPDDIEIYKSYIDVIEFWGPPERQDILYKIYSKGTWM